jgi:hypothetical protein
LTSQSPRFIVVKEAYLRLQNDSQSFHYVYPLIGHSGLGIYTMQRDAANRKGITVAIEP